MFLPEFGFVLLQRPDGMHTMLPNVPAEIVGGPQYRTELLDALLELAGDGGIGLVHLRDLRHPLPGIQERGDVVQLPRDRPEPGAEMDFVETDSAIEIVPDARHQYVS